MSTPKTVRLAAVQAASVGFDTPATIKKLEKYVREAAAPPNLADVIVFPEAFVGCYPHGFDFGMQIGVHMPVGRDWFKRYHDGAIDVDGDSAEFKAIKAVAAECNVVLVVGVIEKEANSSTVYCTAVTIGKDGTLLAKHRKIMPTGPERTIWGHGDGSGIHVVDTGVGRVGAVICWENYIPLLRQAMYSLGIQIYCAPTAYAGDEAGAWLSSMRHIGTEGRCFVIAVNQFVTKADYPPDYPVFQGKEESYHVNTGNSVIVGPLGQILAGPLLGQEGILVAEVDLSDTVRGRLDLDTVGHYSRQDIFKLTVNTTENCPATFTKL